MGERKRIRKVKQKLQELRRSRGVTGRELQNYASQIGYQAVNRGKEPTWEHNRPDFMPLTIPGHSGDLAIGTARRIIDRLLSDIEILEDKLEELEDE